MYIVRYLSHGQVKLKEFEDYFKANDFSKFFATSEIYNPMQIYKEKTPGEELPIAVATNVSNEWGLRQVAVVAWDGEITHVITDGQTIEDKAGAAALGNIIKERLATAKSWLSESTRVLAMRKMLRYLVNKLTRYLDCSLLDLMGSKKYGELYELAGECYLCGKIKKECDMEFIAGLCDECTEAEL